MCWCCLNLAHSDELLNTVGCCCRCWRCCGTWLTADMFVTVSCCCCRCWRCCGTWLTATACWLLWAVVVLGVDTAVEPGSQRWRAHRDHGPGPHLSHQDPRLQLLSGRPWGAGVVVLLGFTWGRPSPETGGVLVDSWSWACTTAEGCRSPKSHVNTWLRALGSQHSGRLGRDLKLYDWGGI